MPFWQFIAGNQNKKNDCSYDRPWDVDILLHRLCLCLSRLLWNHSGQRPDDHSGDQSPSWHLQLYLLFLFVFFCDMVFVESNWANFFSFESQISLMVILLCPKEWLGYCLRSDRKQQWNWSEYEFCSGSDMISLLREWLWTMRAMLLNFLRGMRGRFGVQRRRRWLVFFFQ